MNRQQGATLAIALILLLVVSILAIGSVQVGQMQERMSANLQDKEISFRAAESALNTGEDWLLAQAKQPVIHSVVCPAFPCVRKIYDNINLYNQTPSWWMSNSATYSNQLKNITTSPRYIIEYLQFVPDSPEIGNYKAGRGVHYYRVTARGSGVNNESVTILQTTVARRY